MRKFRSFLCCLLVLCCLLTFVPVNAQAAQVNICTFCGGYCDQFITDYDPIHRIYGQTRYDTSFAIADVMKSYLGMSKFSNIIVASGTDFADALSGSYLASVKGAPILISNGKNTTDIKNYIKNNLYAGGTVYLLGGTNALPASVASGLSGFQVKRLWGATRYETNLAILKEAGVGRQDILVCTGTGFADSLSASAVGLPILLVKGSLSKAQKDFLAGTSGRKIIIGGSNAVSSSLEKALRAYGTTERIGGNTRYETSTLVAKRFFGDPASAVLAYAQNFPDGLCGGPLAYSMGAPLILTASGKEATAAAYTNPRNVRFGYVLGGPGLISDKAARSILKSPSGSSGNSGNTSNCSDTRPRYDLGNCRDLEGNPYVILMYVDDNTSSWDQATADQFWLDTVDPALNFIENWASNWGVSLEFDVGVYRTDPTRNTTLRYNGTIDSYNSGVFHDDILDQLAVSLGYSSKEALDQGLKEFSGSDEILYLILLNKDGRAYCSNDQTNDGYDYMEHCIVFSYFDDYTWDTPASTVAHELLHLYGAEDYYDPHGTQPQRAALAEQIFHDDIMLRVYTDIAYNNVGSYTAYSIGWTHTLPPECNRSEWWN